MLHIEIPLELYACVSVVLYLIQTLPLSTYSEYINKKCIIRTLFLLQKTLS